MPISFTCPQCGKQMNVADSFAGQTGPCSACGQFVRLPGDIAPQPTRRPQSSLGLFIGIGVGTLLLVIAGLGVVVGMSKLRSDAHKLQAKNCLVQLGLALHNFHDTQGRFPPAVVYDAEGKPLYSGRVLLLPYMEMGPLYEQFDLTKAWDAPENRKLSQTPVKLFNDPAGGPLSARCDYVFISGPGAIFEDGKGHSLMEVTDGNSDTVMLLETTEGPSSWAEPKEIDVSQISKLPLAHRSQINLALMADARVVEVRNSLSIESVRKLFVRNDGETVDQQDITRN